MNRRIAFLDRDGTLIDAVVCEGRPYPVASPADVVLSVGVDEGCASLRDAGFHLVMVTNQPDVARGTTDRAVIETVNAALVARLGLDQSIVCYHDDLDDCDCRKPRPGMLLDGAKRLGVALDRSSVMIGDRWRDIEAGRAAGVTTVFIDHGYSEDPPRRPDAVTHTFEAATRWVLASHRSLVHP